MQEVQERAVSSLSRKRRLAIGMVVVCLAVAIGVILVLVLRWPFRQDVVQKQLSDVAFGSKVEIGSFHRTYFPRPGCALERVTFQHDHRPGAAPLITVEKLRIEASFASLFSRHVRVIRAEGLRIRVPQLGSEHFETPQRSSVVVDDLIADGAVLEVTREPSSQPLRFDFRKFTIGNAGASGPASFRADFSNPEPPGQITANGKFGPWSAQDVGKTPVSGEYQFQQADLSVFRGISGMLSSDGRFSGTLDHIESEGRTDTPRFSVASSSHQTQLQAHFLAAVNGENGDTDLHEVTVNFRNTTIVSQGSVARKAGESGKTAAFDFATQNGRIQDILLLFIQAEQSPMSGSVRFRAKAALPAGSAPFLKRVQLKGDFGVDSGNFTQLSTQKEVQHLSEGALGNAARNRTEKQNEAEDPRNVLSDLVGHVDIENGTARFSNLAFRVPGAATYLQGTYNLITEAINLHGTLQTEGEPSGTTSGLRAAMLKMLEPFLKKKHLGYVMPVKITGTYDHPAFGPDFGSQKQQRRDKRAQKALFPS